MSEDNSETNLNDIRESAEFVADSSFRLLRVNILIVGVYLTVGGYLSSLDTGIQQEIATSNYTAAAIICLLMSLLAGYITYESTGRLAAIHMYDDPQAEYENYASTERLVFNLRYAVALALLSVASFGFGILDGFIPGGFSLAYVGRVGFGLLILTGAPIIAVAFGIRFIRWIRDTFGFP